MSPSPVLANMNRLNNAGGGGRYDFFGDKNNVEIGLERAILKQENQKLFVSKFLFGRPPPMQKNPNPTLRIFLHTNGSEKNLSTGGPQVVNVSYSFARD